ncbi:hypothetical protein fugu_018492 [Takifugu bimaculatus]|uniref:Uncharacterized protein n=1 Tax=Takifugu bimaculatus TaxID=433685 RepID=A0A4Z2BPA4_9TELE|nr:hypothetical protein fugu_018492 [Takifugu bimaculatus]
MPKKNTDEVEWVDNEVAPSSEKMVKKGKKDKKGKKSFFEELATETDPVKPTEVKEPQGKQKKKKERRKGKNEDADEDEDDEDHMLRLKKLSLQASDEEDESVAIPNKGSKKKVQNKFAALIQNQSDGEEDADLPEPKEDKKDVKKGAHKSKKPSKEKSEAVQSDEDQKDDDDDGDIMMSAEDAIAEQVQEGGRRSIS